MVLSTFVTIELSFIATKLLTSHILCYRDIVLLSCTAETELCVATDSDDVVTYFLIRSLLLAELFVATLKSLSRQTFLGLSHSIPFSVAT